MKNTFLGLSIAAVCLIAPPVHANSLVTSVGSPLKATVTVSSNGTAKIAGTSTGRLAHTLT